jgi:hypothetical protein
MVSIALEERRSQQSRDLEASCIRKNRLGGGEKVVLRRRIVPVGG